MRAAILCLILSTALLAQKPSWPPGGEPPAQPPVTPPSLPPIEPVGPNGPWIVTIAEKGVYRPDASYNVNDLVRYEGEAYISMAGLNQGNVPSATSTLWLLLPSFRNPLQAGWGTAETVPPDQTARVTISGSKHFKDADSYNCEALADMQLPPESKAVHKATFKATDGSHFELRNVAATGHIGYVCSGR